MDLAEVVAALDRLAAGEFAGEAYRHVAAGRPALSGEGARLVGGRWNPPESFAVLYLALDRDTVARELHRLAARQGLAPEDFMPRDLFTYEVRLQHVIDLREERSAMAVGLAAGLMASDDPTECQLVGQAAHHAGFEGLLAPSATGAGDVLAVFLDRTLPDSIVRDTSCKRWIDPPSVPS